jgi:hypothetical protein
MDESNLIFIISQPRAGSTLLQAIISNHSRVDTMSEHWMLLPFLSLFKPSLMESKYGYSLAIDAFKGFLENTGGPNRFKDEYKFFLLAQYSKLLTSDGNYVLDKTPRYYEILDVIYDFFPRSNYILLKRNPVVVFNSIMKTWDRYTFRKLADYHIRDIFAAPFLMRKWEKSLGGKSNFKVIDYETLVSYPNKVIKEIFDDFKLDYDSSLLNYSSNSSYIGKYGDPVGIHMHEKPSDKYSERWKESLKDSKVKDLLNGYGNFLGRDFLQEYGYSFEPEYSHTLKFRLFKYYCHRRSLVLDHMWKDSIVKTLLQNILHLSV